MRTNVAQHSFTVAEVATLLEMTGQAAHAVFGAVRKNLDEEYHDEISALLDRCQNLYTDASRVAEGEDGFAVQVCITDAAANRTRASVLGRRRR